MVWAASNSKDSEEAPVASVQPPAPAVTVAPVQERMIIERQERLGRIAAIESVQLRPEVSGKIVNIGFNAGELVKAGQVLFEIDPRAYEAEVNRRQAEVARAQARADTTSREANRAKLLFDKRAIASEEAELRESLASEGSADLLAAKAELETAKIDLERTQVRSPIDGRVSRAYVTKGNLVSGNPGGATLLTTIVSTGQVHVYVDLDEAMVQRYRTSREQGDLLLDGEQRVPVELRLDQSDKYAFSGYVESLDNQIDPATGSLTVRLLFNDPKGQLLPGAFARVRIPLSGEQSKLVVSERAIGTDQSQKYVLAVKPDNSVAYKTVTLGASIGDQRIIESGIEKGERIIVNGLQRVRPGMTVQPELAASSESADSQVAQR